MTEPKKSMRGFPDPSLRLQLPPASTLDLRGRGVVVVGGTDGLGRAIARLAASQGAAVTVVGRTFRDEGTPNLTFVRADLSSMKEAQRVGRALPVDGVDVVVLTTGIMAAKAREQTAEGVERDLAVSYLSRFVLLRELAPRLAGGAGGRRPRVFVMGFPGAGEGGDPDDLNAERRYDATAAHMNTVAANEALVLAASRRASGASFFGLNPGLVKTGIRANLLGAGSALHRAAEFVIGLFTPTPEAYAARVVPLFFAPELEGRTGQMFGAKADPILPSAALTAPRVDRFTEASEALAARALS